MKRIAQKIVICLLAALTIYAVGCKKDSGSKKESETVSVVDPNHPGIGPGTPAIGDVMWYPLSGVCECWVYMFVIAENKNKWVTTSPTMCDGHPADGCGH